MRIVEMINKAIPQKARLVLHIIIEKMKDVFTASKRKAVYEEQEKKGLSTIPIFLISFNRLSYLERMIKRLEEMGKTNIIIIDNASSYPPLLEYYNTIPYEVIRLKENGGHKVFWENPVFNKYREQFYIVSDPDIEPIAECPHDFVEIFFKVLKEYSFVRKAGFSLKIDDIPDTSIFADQAVKWEKDYYGTKIEKDNIYYAGIDTTLALYVPDQLAYHLNFYSAFRTGFPYQARHLPWYKTSAMITEEDVFYSEYKTNGWWDNAKGEVTPDNNEEV